MEFDDIKKMINGMLNDLSKLSKGEKKTIKRTIDSSNLKGVIDVSLDKEEKIPREKFDDKPLIKDYKYWILKLDRYYKNPAMRVNQINIASLKAYADLCDCLEHYLNKKGTSIARLVSRLRREQFSYDIYYTIYLIAENTVLSFYNPLYNKSAEKSYQIIENSISIKARYLLESRVQELFKNLKAPDKETREYFSLTANNKVSTWWDKDGHLREKYNISKDEEIAINQISKRNNVLWKNPQVVKLLLDMYLFTLRKIFDNDEIDSNSLIRIMKPYKQSKLALESILIISEKNIREVFTFFNKSNQAKAEENLVEFDGGDLLEFIEKTQKSYIKIIDPGYINKIYEDELKENPGKIKDYVNYIGRLDLRDKISFMEEISRLDKFPKILQAIVKSDNAEDRIIALFYIYKLDYNKKSHENILFEIIKADNVDDFISLVESRNMDLATYEEIKSLNKNKLKRIEVDINRIDRSRDNLSKTISMVNEFLDDDKPEEDFPEDTKEENQDNSGKYHEILKKILENGSMNKEEFEDFAIAYKLTTNTFLGKINDELFDFVGDQALIIEDDNVIIDPFYVEMVKEYLDGNKN